jgi:hypothetical protein
MAPQRPRFGKIPSAVQYSGYGRTTLYAIAAKNPELFRKAGRSTVVDFDVLDQLLDQLPTASIKAA